MPSFFFQGGLVSRHWLLQKQGYNTSNNEKTVKYTTKYPNSALNAGLGWNWISKTTGISGGIYFVTIIGSGPERTYESDTDYVCSDTCKSDYENSLQGGG